LTRSKENVVAEEDV